MDALLIINVEKVCDAQYYWENRPEVYIFIKGQYFGRGADVSDDFLEG